MNYKRLLKARNRKGRLFSLILQNFLDTSMPNVTINIVVINAVKIFRTPFVKGSVVAFEKNSCVPPNIAT